MCALAKKKAIYKYIDFAVEAYEEYLKTSFFGWGSPCEFIVEPNQNRTVIDVRGRLVKNFHFVETIDE